MKKNSLNFLVLGIYLLISACGLLPGASAPEPTPMPTLEIPPTVTETVIPTVTEAVPTTAPVVVQTPPVLAYPADISSSAYMDDRSTAAALILSYYNAVNRQEYLRAYSYWGDPANTVGSYDVFSNGYRDTGSVAVVIGQVYAEGAAGTSYFTVPVALNVTNTDQTRHKYAACYVLRLPQPGNFGAPPISPMNIYRGIAKTVSLNTSDAATLAAACNGPDYPTAGNGAGPVLENLPDISSASYIDNRSGALEMISSYFNALNRLELVRAYSYWKTPATYANFEAEYTDWGQITALTFGETTSDAGAGQMYFQTPVVLARKLPDGSLHVQSACFVMHLSQPTFQAAPPFDPLGITSLTYQPVLEPVDPLTLLSTACP
jgi:hypothetical protein